MVTANATIPAPAGEALKRAEGDDGDEVERSSKKYEVTVRGKRIREWEPSGKYQQPYVMTKRPFAGTDVYVQPAGQLALDVRLDLNGDITNTTRNLFSSILEFEFGLDHRLQFDFLFGFEQNGSSGPMSLAWQELELRYAFSDWGKIWGNPSLYLEWIRKNGKPQGIESKLLLCDMINDRWFWGANIAFELELGEEYEPEFALSAGLGHAVVPGLLTMGLEAKAVVEDENVQSLIGPSAQIKFPRGARMTIVPMVGLKSDENGTKGSHLLTFVLGRDF